MNVLKGLAPAVDNLGLRAVSLRTRCRTAAWRLRAQGGHRDFLLRTLAARKSLQILDPGRRVAANIAAIRSSRGDIFDGNSRVAGQIGISLRLLKCLLSVAYQKKCSFLTSKEAY